ncbi:MAG: DUF4931 domain-containing protein [bacterium]|jgi:galactose-1-phosphate uridylyltransferase
MARLDYLIFNAAIGQQKPQNMHNRAVKCPFCDRESLTGIIAEEWPLLLLENKYPVLEDTFQTVLIETNVCNDELSNYSPDHMHRLLRFGVKHWIAMQESGEFASVLFYKNHGPYSGGTITHPHMQIVGLKNVDYRQKIKPRQFFGPVVAEESGVMFNVSDRPRVGFFEFNIILTDQDKIDTMADFIQKAAHYALNGFHNRCTSYNIFFYRLDDGLAAKVMPRFVTSPLFIGFSITQVSNRLDAVAREIRENYFCCD